MYSKQGNLYTIKAPITSRMEPVKANEPKQTLKAIYDEMNPKPDILINGNMFNMSTGEPVNGMKIGDTTYQKASYGGHILYDDGEYHIKRFPNINVPSKWALEGIGMIKPYDNTNINAGFTTGLHKRSTIGLSKDSIYVVSVTDEVNFKYLQNLPIAKEIDTWLNLDGGGSVGMIVDGKEVIHSSREIDNAIAIYLDKPILIIDPGHGGTDPGGGTNDKWIEKDMALKISLYQRDRFNELGVKVALTRDSDISLSPIERTDIVKNSGATYCFSNHINNTGDGSGDGAEVIHSIYSDGKLSEQIANAIQNEGQNIRRVFTRTLPNDPKHDYYFMQRDTGAVSTLIIEYGFADSKQDDVTQILEHWKDYAEAVVKAFCTFIGHKYIAPVKAPRNELPSIIKEFESVLDKLKALKDSS